MFKFYLCRQFMKVLLFQKVLTKSVKFCLYFCDYCSTQLTKKLNSYKGAVICTKLGNNCGIRLFFLFSTMFLLVCLYYALSLCQMLIQSRHSNDKMNCKDSYEQSP